MAPSPVVRRPSAVVRRPSSVVHCPLSIVCRPSSVVRHPLSVVRRPVALRPAPTKNSWTSGRVETHSKPKILHIRSQSLSGGNRPQSTNGCGRVQAGRLSTAGQRTSGDICACFERGIRKTSVKLSTSKSKDKENIRETMSLEFKGHTSGIACYHPYVAMIVCLPLLGGDKFYLFLADMR